MSQEKHVHDCAVGVKHTMCVCVDCGETFPNPDPESYPDPAAAPPPAPESGHWAKTVAECKHDKTQEATVQRCTHCKSYIHPTTGQPINQAELERAKRVIVEYGIADGNSTKRAEVAEARCRELEEELRKVKVD